MKAKLKKNVKQDYTIEFHQIQNLDIGEGVEVILKWRRGDKKENKGRIEKAQIHDKEIIYSPPQTVKIHCTLFSAKNGYEEKSMEVSLHTLGKKGKELCKGYIDLAKYADLNGEAKTIHLELSGKTTCTVKMSVSSLLGEAGGSSDETEVLMVKQQSQTNIHELLVQQVNKTKMNEVNDEDEEALEERQRRQKEIEEQEEMERRKMLEKEEKQREEDLFAAASSGVKIKGKKEKDSKKKFTQEDVDKAVEKAVKEALKESKEKNRRRKEEFAKELSEVREEKVCSFHFF